MLNWNLIRTVLLDMDGTLLDLHFDNHFWLEHVPLRYAERNGLTLEEAKRHLLIRYRKVEGTMDWYCLDYWTRELGMDVAVLKEEVDHLIAVHPYVVDFLRAVRAAGRRIVLVTNAHGKSVALKMRRTEIGAYLHRVVCAHDLGLPKEDPRFWGKLARIEPFEPARCVLIDDNLAVLRSARAYGIAQLRAVLRPDSRHRAKDVGEFEALGSFEEVLPVPPLASHSSPRSEPS